jgi:hypothetical protein
MATKPLGISSSNPHDGCSKAASNEGGSDDAAKCEARDDHDESEYEGRESLRCHLPAKDASVLHRIGNLVRRDVCVVEPWG